MAKFKVAAVFSSNMVLQRDCNIKIFGYGENDEIITIAFLGESYTTKVKEDKWTIILPPRSAGVGYEMTVSCKNEEKKFHNIAIGEVWLAGGQSNMEFELNRCKGGEELLQNDKNTNVRFYNTNRNSNMDEYYYEMEDNTAWSEFGEDSAKAWSAVGYIYGKKLAKDLNVTVGIIGCNWGGTSASCWMSEDSLRADADLNSYLQEYHKAMEGKTDQEQIDEYYEYEAYNAAWDKKCAKLYARKPDTTWQEALDCCGENKWPGPKNFRNPFRPSGLYQCMLQRIMPYSIRGFLFYQGESDDHKPEIYQKLLTRMIQQWREDWENNSLAFIMVQLPMYRNEADEDFKHWCLIREAQMNTFQTIKNTGIAVAIDCGVFNDIHPKDKSPVGERLALQALYHVYEKIDEQKAFGPIYKTFEYKDGKIELSFDYVDNGFVVKGETYGFEIAGDDRNYIEADIEISASKIIVSSAKVINPMYARYCWTNYGEVTIYGRNGIALAPFRTSNKDLQDSIT